MKKILLGIVTLVLLNSTSSAYSGSDNAFLMGKSFAQKWGRIENLFDYSVKSKSNWDLCVYLLKDWKSDNKFIEQYRHSSGYDRSWVEGCEIGMRSQHKRGNR